MAFTKAEVIGQEAARLHCLGCDTVLELGLLPVKRRQWPDGETTEYVPVGRHGKWKLDDRPFQDSWDRDDDGVLIWYAFCPSCRAAGGW